MRMKKLFKLHNETLVQRETKYIDTIKREKLAGEIDLFDQ